MKIINFETVFNGGTLKIDCIDRRIETTIKNKLYNGYSKKDNSNIIENSVEIEKEIYNVLAVYDYKGFYKTIIHDLISNKQ